MDESSSISIDTPLGTMWLWATSYGLCGLGFGESVPARMLRHMARHHIAAPRPVATELLGRAREQLLAYFDWKRRAFDLPLDLRGTNFQRSVWDRLLDIPYGKTVTYGEIALQVGNPRASQAVGRAVGANPISIIVPCHRVVGADGSLTGYGGGLERKAALLELEQKGLQLQMSFD